MQYVAELVKDFVSFDDTQSAPLLGPTESGGAVKMLEFHFSYTFAEIILGGDRPKT